MGNILNSEMLGPRHTRGLAVLSALLLAMTAACGDSAPSPDYGPYDTALVSSKVDDAASNARGILVESLRIGEQLVFAQQIESDLTYGRSAGVIVDHAGTSGPLSAAARAALAPFEVLGGFSAVAGNAEQAGEKDTKSLTISILALPSAELAVAASQAMAATDLPDSIPLPITGLPGALGYWRPTSATAGSWSTWKSLVIAVTVKFDSARVEQLGDILARANREQLTALNSFTPTRASDLASLKLDPDQLLPRLVHTGASSPNKLDYAVYGPRAFALLLDRPATRLAEFREHKVTTVALSHNNLLHRTDSPDSADTFARSIENLLTTTGYVTLDPGPGVSDVSCYRATKPDPLVIEARRYTCLVRHEEFVVRVNSNQESDVRQLAAAQASLLAQDR